MSKVTGAMRKGTGTDQIGRRVKMPFAVEQPNAVNVSAVVSLYGILFWIFCGGYRPASAVLLTVALSCGPLAVLFGIGPFNPFRGFIDSRRRGSRPLGVAELSEIERRILVRCYDPRNRRRAVISILALAGLLLTGWLVSLQVMARPIGVRPLRLYELVPIVAGLGLAPAGWVGLFGLTKSARKNWSVMTVEGPMWPLNIEYPGPLREAVRSFVTGRLPDFILNGLDVHTSQ
ncbi:MAG: hypothetical protein ACRD1B_00615 [Thermoanaerobaculia bacterium]